MLYNYGLSLGMKLALHGRLKESLRYFVIPVNYWRYIEYRLIYDAGGFRSKDRILDIGSPKLFPFYLADRVGAEVYSTDIENYFLREYELLRTVNSTPPDRFHAQVEDGRRLTFEDAFFSKVVSISVLEHIPQQGDSECAREIGRVLEPGGRCLITVPFATTSRDEYKKPRFYWAKSSGARADGLVFYQRRYTEQDIMCRIVGPSGLTLKSLRFVGEHVLTSCRRELSDYLPRPTGPIQPLLSKLFHTRPVDSWQELKKPLCALIVLEKPGAP
jgi:SAM-dependent methyltransferase